MAERQPRLAPWMATTAVIAVLPVVLTWPLAARFRTHILAAPDQEAAPHIWGLWAAARTLSPLRIETVLQAFPEGVGLVLVDPLNLPAFHLGHLLGPAAAYNTVLWSGVVLMGLAGALLARTLGGRPWLGAVVAMACPTLLANAADGMTEGFGVGIVGIFLALTVRAVQAPRPGRVVAAGLALGATAWAGPYNAIWAAILGLGLAAGCTATRRWTQLRTTVLVGGLGTLCGLPVGWAIFQHRDEGLPGGSDRAGLPEIIENPDIFRGGVRTGADLLDPLLPVALTGGEADVSHTAYIGVVLLCAAIWTAVKTPRARPYVAAALGFVLLSFGPWLYVGGSVPRPGGSPLAAPAGLAMVAVPVLGRLTRWYRAGAVVTLLLAPVASLAPKTPHGRVVLALAIVLDALLLAPLAWPLHATALPPVASLAHLPHEGALLELPPVTSGAPPPGGWRDLSVLAQVVHGRPIGGSMMGLGVSTAARSGVEAVRVLLRSGELSASTHLRLRQDGFRYLVVHRGHHPLPQPGENHLLACFGAPLIDSETLLVFDLGASDSPAGCSPRPASSPGL